MSWVLKIVQRCNFVCEPVTCSWTVHSLSTAFVFFKFKAVKASCVVKGICPHSTTSVSLLLSSHLYEFRVYVFATRSPRGYYSEFLVEACSSGKVFRLLLLTIRQTLPLFQTKKFNFPVPSLQSWSLKFVPFPRSGLLNPYLFSDFQTKMVKIPLQPISDQNGSKTIPFGAGYTYIAYVGELPPPPPSPPRHALLPYRAEAPRTWPIFFFDIFIRRFSVSRSRENGLSSETKIELIAGQWSYCMLNQKTVVERFTGFANDSYFLSAVSARLTGFIRLRLPFLYKLKLLTI